MRSYATFLVIFLAVPSALGQSGVSLDNRTLDEIYAAAKLETGPLTIAMGGDVPSQSNFITTAWNTRFPDVNLSVTVDYSKYHDSRIDRSFQGSGATPDIALLQTYQDYVRWKDEGRLLNYKVKNWDDIYEEKRDQDGAFTSLGISNFGRVFFDGTKVSAGEIPNSFADFADPKWAGKMILTYPNDDDAVLYLFSTLVSKYGWGYLDQLSANNVTWVRGTVTPSLELQRRHNDTSDGVAVTFTIGSASGAGSWLQVKEMPAPDQYMIWSFVGGIFANTIRPNMAKLFVSWMLDPAHVNGTAATGGRVVLESLDQGRLTSANNTQYGGFRKFMLDRQNTEWWRFQFETSLGTAQGPSSLKLYS